jgi:hypothetical protein
MNVNQIDEPALDYRTYTSRYSRVCTRYTYKKNKTHFKHSILLLAIATYYTGSIFLFIFFTYAHYNKYTHKYIYIYSVIL